MQTQELVPFQAGLSHSITSKPVSLEQKVSYFTNLKSVPLYLS